MILQELFEAKLCWKNLILSKKNWFSWGKLQCGLTFLVVNLTDRQKKYNDRAEKYDDILKKLEERLKKLDDRQKKYDDRLKKLDDRL